jgi:hypothetical protein
MKQRLTVGVFPYNPDSDGVAFALSRAADALISSSD